MKLCTYFETNGTCKNGDACGFAHGAHDLACGKGKGGGGGKDAGKGGDKGGGPGVWSGQKTRMCTNWESTGSCPRAPNCTFAHGQAEMAGKGAGGGGGKSWDGGKGGGKDKGKDGFKGPMKKMKLCTYFEAQGSCSRGAECTFAHGQHEIGTMAGGGKAGGGKSKPAWGTVSNPAWATGPVDASGQALGDDPTSQEIKRLMAEQKQLEADMAKMMGGGGGGGGGW